MYANVNEHLEAIKKIYSSIEDVKKSTVPVGENFIILDADGTGNDYYVGFLSYTNDGTGIDLKNGLFLNRRIQTQGDLEQNIAEQIKEFGKLVVDSIQALEDKGDEIENNIIDQGTTQVDRIDADYSKAMVEDTIDSLKSSGKYRIGDVVEVLGYYVKGDGAGHKRLISATRSSGGVALAGGNFANIIDNGTVNVSWLGAKGDSVTDDSVYCQEFEKNKNYVFDKKFYLFSSIDIPIGTSISGVNVFFKPTNGNSIFKMSRKNCIKINNAFLIEGYNGYCFELNSNEKARIEAKFGETVDEPIVSSFIESINVNGLSDNVDGYIIKYYCDGNHFGMYGVDVKNISGRAKIKGLINSNLLKLSANRTSWITGMSFSDIILGGITGNLFNLENFGSDTIYEGWSFKNVQLQAGVKGSRMFFLQKCKAFRFDNIIPWDWGSYGDVKPFYCEECDTMYFSDNMVGGYTYIENKNSNLTSFEISNATRNLNEFITHTNPIKYKELLKMPDGEYYIFSPLTFLNLGCYPGNFGTIKLKRDFGKKITRWEVFYKTNGAQYEEGLSNALAVIKTDDTETDFNANIESKVWKKTPKNSELYKGVMMNIGTFSGRPNVDSVPNGYLYICTNPAQLHYKVNGIYNVVSLVPSNV